MWRLYNRILTIAIFIFTLQVPASHTEISAGIRFYNNQWQETWLLTPAPELTFSSKWVALQFDGRMGTYSPVSAPDNYVLQSHFAMIPMLRLKVGPLESSLGYGYAYRFRREEIYNDSEEWEFSSTQESGGEFRFLFGLGFSVSERMNLHLNGGYHYLNEDNRAFSFGMNLGFKSSNPVIQKVESEMPDSISDPVETVNSPEPPVSQPAKQIENKTPTPTPATKPEENRRIKTVCLIETNDNFINEINASLEAALISNGISVLNWAKIKEAVRLNYQDQNTNNLNSISTQANRDDWLMDDMQTLFNGAGLFPLDAAIETRLRYIYETYGGAILVNAAYVRLLDPQTGEVIITIEYDKPESSFSECKTALTMEVIQKLLLLD
jgi:hypothetical protein